MTSAADYESGDTAVNGSRVASSNYSNFPTRYYLYYNAGIRGGTTTNPPLVTNIKFYEFYVS